MFYPHARIRSRLRKLAPSPCDNADWKLAAHLVLLAWKSANLFWRGPSELPN